MTDAEKRDIIFKVLRDFLTKNPDKTINVYYRFRKKLFLPLSFQGSKPMLNLGGRLISFHHAATKHFGPMVGAYDTRQNAHINFSFLYTEILQVPEFRSVEFKVNKDGFCRKLNYFAIEYIYQPVIEVYPIGITNSPVKISPVVDYVERAIRNEEIGSAGEIFVIEEEKRHLISIGRQDLAAQVLKQPDGLGYDIRSFQDNGEPKYIEVKTTTGNFSTEFFITDNEVKFMQQQPGSYYLYRVHNFNLADNQGTISKLHGKEIDNLDFRAKVFSCNPIV